MARANLIAWSAFSFWNGKIKTKCFIITNLQPINKLYMKWCTLYTFIPLLWPFPLTYSGFSSGKPPFAFLIPFLNDKQNKQLTCMLIFYFTELFYRTDFLSITVNIKNFYYKICFKILDIGSAYFRFVYFRIWRVIPLIECTLAFLNSGLIDTTWKIFLNSEHCYFTTATPVQYYSKHFINSTCFKIEFILYFFTWISPKKYGLRGLRWKFTAEVIVYF